MGKHSGRAAFRAKLKDLGYDLGDNAVEDAFRRFKDLADRKKDVFDEDIHRPGRRCGGRAATADPVQVSLEVLCGIRSGRRSAELELEIDGGVRGGHGDRRRAGGRHLQRHQGSWFPTRRGCSCSRCMRSPRAPTPRPR